MALLAYFVFGVTDLQAREIYAPDGTPRVTSAIENQLGFNSSYHDEESGLVYKRARYYSENQGRFISRDPIGYIDGESLYTAYAMSRFSTDSTGLSDDVQCNKLKPGSNGCGTKDDPKDDKPDGITSFKKACNLHDICYSTCGKKKDKCDEIFKKAMYAECDKIKDETKKQNVRR